MLQPLVEAALLAGADILRHYGRKLAVAEKADRSPVTAADRGAEAIILERLAQVSSSIPVVAEEEAAGRIPSVSGRFFLVDPLDGTLEFVRQSPDFTVNIALVENSEPRMGVVYAPAHGWLFAGDVKTGVAWRSDVENARETGERKPIHTRPPPSAGLVILDSRSHRSPATQAYLELLGTRERIAHTRQVGSSLKFCLIAAGEADLYARFGPTMEWDTAAGHAVLAAAGGSVMTPEGQPLRYAKPQFRNGEFIARGQPRSK